VTVIALPPLADHKHGAEMGRTRAGRARDEEAQLPALAGLYGLAARSG